MSFLVKGNGEKPNETQTNNLSNVPSKEEGTKLKSRTVSWTKLPPNLSTTITSMENSGGSTPGETTSQQNAATNKPKKGFFSKFFSSGVSLSGKKKKDDVSKNSEKAEKPLKDDWKKTQSDSVLLRQPATKSYSVNTMPLDKYIDMPSLEKDLKGYFSKLTDKEQTSILRADLPVVKDIRQFMVKHGIDKWFQNEIVKNPKVVDVMHGLITTFNNEASLKKFDGQKKEFITACGEKLFAAIQTALVASFTNSEKPMPPQFSALMQIINHELKKRFPEINAEVTTHRLFFLLYIIPPFTQELTSMEELKVRGELIKGLNEYVQTLPTLPKELTPLFMLTFDQVERATESHLSKIKPTNVGGTIFREESDEEMLVKRWVAYFGSDWIDAAIVKNKHITSTIDDCLLEIEDDYQNQVAKVPADVKAKWGKKLFEDTVNAILKANQPMPDEILQLANLINQGVKKKFPEIKSEKLVCSMMFLRFLIPPMLMKDNELSQLSTKERIIVVKSLQDHINNNLEELPKELESFFFKS